MRREEKLFHHRRLVSKEEGTDFSVKYKIQEVLYQI